MPRPSANVAAALLAANLFIAIAVPAADAAPRAVRTPADLVLTNGVVRTLDPDDRVVGAVAMTDGAITYVGDAEGARAFEGPRTRVVDVGGSVVLPGLADAHVHPALGEYLHHRLCDVRALTVEEGFAKVRHCRITAPAGDWVVAYGWYDLDQPAFDHVALRDLDALVQDRLLAVISKDLHTTWVNSRTLAAFGITRDTPDPAGGAIQRDLATGEPTGTLFDAAGQAIVYRIQHASPYAAPLADVHRTAVRYLNSLGITSLVDAFADDDTLAAWRELDARGQLPMRVSVAMPVAPGNYRTEIARIAAHRAEWSTSHVRVDFIKVIADGNPEVGLASLLNHGSAAAPATPGYFTRAQMQELVGLADAAGIAVFVHVIGDAAARDVLDGIEAARRARPETSLRHTLTHLQWVDDADIGRLKTLQVIANIQEGWLAPAAFGGPPGYDYARSTAAGPVGPWRAGRMFPYAPLVRTGARIAAGSDWFYTEENPWMTIEAGATSRDPGGTNRVPMLPEHAIDVATLVRARTSGAAYQMYLDHETGTLEAGKRADLVVIDRDPFTAPVDSLHGTKVLMTVFDGRVVWEHGATSRGELR